MTSQRFKQLSRASSSTIREELTKPLDPPITLPPDGGLFVFAEHPEDGIGIRVQSELDAQEQRLTQHRFHCFSLSPKELRVFVKAANKALRHSRSFSKEYFKGNR